MNAKQLKKKKTKTVDFVMKVEIEFMNNKREMRKFVIKKLQFSTYGIRSNVIWNNETEECLVVCVCVLFC